MINGQLYKDAFISGANNITNNKQSVDELNVFPVPDGDTGTNMSMTINAAKQVLVTITSENASVSEVASSAASALLRGARGNSGVILSLLFRGIANGLKEKQSADGADFAHALTLGVESAYKAVMKPTEGTILTVARLAAEHATEFAKTNDDFVAVFNEIVISAEQALNSTPELLPVLKKAGVVDAGGMGLLTIFKGMQSVFNGNGIIASKKDAAKTKSDGESVVPERKKSAVAEAEEEINFTYCTEFIVNRGKSQKGALALRAYLESIGDCVVVVDDEDIIKVHVHTNNPGNALQEGLKFGMLSNMKIENMKEQHSNRVYEEEQKDYMDDYAPVDPDREIGFVAVAAGQGLQALFTDLGVDKVVSGGQTMNPSTDDILKAIKSVPAKTVFVLPNNKNIIMAAEQAVKLADRNVCVLQTRTIPQGLSAMLAFDPDENIEENLTNMTHALDSVSTGQITFAARDSDFDGHKIKEGEILALDNGKLSFAEKDVEKAAVRLTSKLARRAGISFVTVIYGADVSDSQAQQAYEAIAAKLGNDIEVNLINGGQPVYYYIISAE